MRSAIPRPARRPLAALLAVGAVHLAAAVAWGAGWPAAPGNPPACDRPAAAIPLDGPSCGVVAPPQLSCFLPADVFGALRQPDLNTRQRASDILAWQTFLSLQWPASDDPAQRGQPDPKKPLGAPGPRTWETWAEPSAVYLPDGARPPPFGVEPGPLPAACRGLPRGRILLRTAKVDDVVDDPHQPTVASAALPDTLKDQHGRLVRYEIRMNRVMYDYVVQNGFYDAHKQAAAAAIDPPPGAILIKAAWRELAADEAKEMLSEEACVCEQDKTHHGLAGCRVATVGLAGFHVMQKTASAPQWIWSTFEDAGNEAAFYNPACVECPVNQQTPPGIPCQVRRMTPIPDRNPDCAHPAESNDNVALLNRNMAAGVGAASRAIARYRLISSQWPIPAAKQPATVFDVRPGLLANTTLETFIQDTSSCMGCHAMARSTNPDRFVSASFSFTLNDAMPALTDPEIIPPPATPQDPWERTNWSDIMAGYRITTETYEVLPGPVGNKLHCQSCHLDGGGNPRAAWWVGTLNRFPWPTCFQNRVNSCFEKSMAGHAVCSTVPDANGKTSPCDTSEIMRALRVYMEWLDRRWQQRHDGRPLPDRSGFPPIPTLDGVAARGQSIYLQKCAFCHGADLQGRYGGGVYFRPALQGPRSFNICAGMASQSSLAAFVRANMPYGSGGELTDQEAWDLAAFVDGGSRPCGTAAPPAGTCGTPSPSASTCCVGTGLCTPACPKTAP